MKKALCLFLSSLFCLATLQGCVQSNNGIDSIRESDSETADQKIDWSSLSEHDFDLLYDVVKIFSLLNVEYDYQKDNANTVIEKIITEALIFPNNSYRLLYKYYYNALEDEAEFEMLPDDKDPLNRFENNEHQKVRYGNFKFPEAKVDWIVRNIFNIDAIHSLDGASLYYYDGYYYKDLSKYLNPLTNRAATIDDVSNILLNLDNIKGVDGKGKYYIEFSCERKDSGTSKRLYMITQLKQIDGEKYWSFYKISSSPIEKYQ